MERIIYKTTHTNLIDKNVIIHTDGNGEWSTTRAAIQIIAVEITDTEDGHFIVNVAFNKDHWDVSSDGLIYTDARALTELKDVLADYVDHDLNNLEYTEAGMQGKDFISLEINC